MPHDGEDLKEGDDDEEDELGYAYLDVR